MESRNMKFENVISSGFRDIRFRIRKSEKIITPVRVFFQKIALPLHLIIIKQSCLFQVLFNGKTWNRTLNISYAN